MQQATKQRIVGSVVLIALALIVLPIIFDGQGSYDSQITSRIPETPVVESLTPRSPTRPIIRANQPGFGETAAEAENVTASTPTLSDDPDAFELSDTETNSSANASATDEITEKLAAVVNSEPSFIREAPQLGPDGLPQGWSVRLGTFSDASNAQTLLNRLLSASYKAYAIELERDQGTLTAILVGPWLDRQRADDYQKELQAEFQLAGIVERYSITAP